MKKIGLVGTNGSGKTSAGAFFKKQNFLILSLSDIVREEAARLGLSLERHNLIHTANELKRRHGQDYLARMVYKKAQGLSAENVVFDSIRNEAEMQYLQSHGVRIVGVDAPLKLRYQRVQGRNDTTDNIDFETFERLDALENNGSSFGQNIRQCLLRCEKTIINDGSMDVFFQALAEFVSQQSPSQVER